MGLLLFPASARQNGDGAWQQAEIVTQQRQLLATRRAVADPTSRLVRTGQPDAQVREHPPRCRDASRSATVRSSRRTGVLAWSIADTSLSSKLFGCAALNVGALMLVGAIERPHGGPGKSGNLGQVIRQVEAASARSSATIAAAPLGAPWRPVRPTRLSVQRAGAQQH